MPAAERYVWALLVATQRWAPPALVLVGLIAWIWVTPPVGVDTVRIVLVVLFALAGWLGHATATGEEPGQELIAVSNLGSATRLLLARWSVAAVLAVAFPLVMLVASCAYDRLARPWEPPGFTVAQAVAAALALLATAAAGAALGTLVAGVVPGRPGWAAGILILLSLGQAAPWLLPVPPLAAALPGRDQGLSLSLLLAVGLAGLLTAALLVAARVVRRPVR